MGLASQDHKVVRHAHTVSRRSHICFTSVGVHKNQVNVMEDAGSDCDLDNWIFPTVGNGLNNWTTEDIISISFSRE